MSFVRSIFRALFFRRDGRVKMLPLYKAVIANARELHWYKNGKVSDTINGRFDMIAAVLSLVLIRLEEECPQETVWLTELFVDDMDGQLREIGIGDVVVGKHIGRMMSALGGRLTAYREGLAEGGDLEAALVRNLYRSKDPGKRPLSHVAKKLREFGEKLETFPVEELKLGHLPE